MNRIWKKRLFMLLVMLLCLTALSGCVKKKFMEAKRTERPVPTETVPTVAETEPQLKTKAGIQTMLILCLDEYDTMDGIGGFRNHNRADFAMLMVIDERFGTITSVQLNPDTVVPFAVPGKSETVEMPLSQVFSFGSGGSDSSLYVTKAVSKLLGGIKVDNYLTFTMDAVGLVNDMIGGVTVPAEETAELQADQAEGITLSGEDAVAYFTLREENDVMNEAHMLRQRLYMGAMYAPFMARAQNEDFLTRLSLQLGEGMATGLTLSELIQTFETMSAYTMGEEVLTVPGNLQQVNGQTQFVADQNALNQLVHNLFADK